MLRLLGGTGVTDSRTWGVETVYEGHGGERTEAPPETVDHLVGVLSQGRATPLPASCLVIRRGERRRLSSPSEVVTEDGANVRAVRELPPDLPLGYHELVSLDDDSARTLIVSPGLCHLPENLFTWGFAIQLYALRSQASWGMGDLADLRNFAAWTRRRGSRVTMINPLHAVNPGVPQQRSPYFPSTRCFQNPLYLRIEEIPGASEAAEDVESLARAARNLNEGDLVRRDDVYQLKMNALETLWAKFRGDRDFERFKEAEGDLLTRFATFNALFEHHGGPPRTWPSEHRNPWSGHVQRFGEGNKERIDFHRWLQWLLDRQLRQAGEESGVLYDLAIGVDPDGADAWMFGDAFTKGVSVGAPPDPFNAAGQDWGVVAFNPVTLTQAAYEPFVRTVRAALKAGGGLRVDHVMGLFRLFWIPAGGAPEHGAYVRYPAADLLNVLALESQRAGAFVVGEDLGTVEPGVRDELAARNILSYRLMLFESDPPKKFPDMALAAATNHDLPTLPGLWTGADLAAQRNAGLQPDEEGMATIRRRLAEIAGVAVDAPVDEAVGALYAALGSAPSRLVMGQLEDALGWEKRPNMPGTIDEWPNWALALPLPFEEISGHPGVEAVVRSLSARRKS